MWLDSTLPHTYQSKRHGSQVISENTPFRGYAWRLVMSQSSQALTGPLEGASNYAGRDDAAATPDTGDARGNEITSLRKHFADENLQR